ncbi:unnamed protein product [Rotaria magnacalcarata]
MSCVFDAGLCKIKSFSRLLGIVIGVLLLGGGICGFYVTNDECMRERSAYEEYQNTSCLTTAYEFVKTRCNKCPGSFGRGAVGCHHDVCYSEAISISYITWNGTLVNNTARTSFSRVQHHARKIGSQNECFYKKQNVTSLVWKISYDKCSLMKVLACIGFVVLGCALLCGIMLAKKQEENQNATNRYTQARTTPLHHMI